MAEDVLSLEKRSAGAEYLAALRQLGCEPEALFWAKDAIVGNDVLVLVTSLFDYAGPLDLSQLLFKAYNLSATPNAIDPFILRLHSPRHVAIREMARTFGLSMTPPFYLHSVRPDLAHHGVRVSGLSMGADVTVYADWIYKFDLRGKVATVETSRRWRRFEANVEKLAA